MTKNTPLLTIVAIVLVVLLGGWYATRQGISTSPSVQSHRSFTVVSDARSKNYQSQQPAPYTFSIVDDQGATVKDFATVHEKIMHVIIVRKDLAEFQHVHPEFNQATGQFTLAHLIFPSDGPYRIFADFTPHSAQRGADGQPLTVTIHEDVNVGNRAKYQPQPLVKSQLTKPFQGYSVQLIPAPTPITAETSTTLSFAIAQNGRLVTNLEKYLGALGHAVVLREGDLEFLHTHALDERVTNQTGTVDFAVTFPTAGTYKIFSQFQHGGSVITTDFVVTAEERAAGTNEGYDRPTPLEHSLPNEQH